MSSAKIQGGGNTNPGGNPILNTGKANCWGGGGAPPAPPEINPRCKIIPVLGSRRKPHRIKGEESQFLLGEGGGCFAS